MKLKVLTPIIIAILISSCLPNQPLSNSQDLPTQTSTPDQAEITPSTYSIDEVAVHNQTSDCWTIINNKVYDLSQFTNHPGASVYQQACGVDATDLFETRPMGSQTPHSSNARQMLENYYIGNVKL